MKMKNNEDLKRINFNKTIGKDRYNVYCYDDKKNKHVLSGFIEKKDGVHHLRQRQIDLIVFTYSYVFEPHELKTIANFMECLE